MPDQKSDPSADGVNGRSFESAAREMFEWALQAALAAESQGDLRTSLLAECPEVEPRNGFVQRRVSGRYAFLLTWGPGSELPEFWANASFAYGK